MSDKHICDLCGLPIYGVSYRIIPAGDLGAIYEHKDDRRCCIIKELRAEIAQLKQQRDDLAASLRVFVEKVENEA